MTDILRSRRRRRAGLCPLLALLAAWPAGSPSALAAPEGVDAFYPEGPLRVGTSVFYAEMQRDRVVEWTGTDTRTLFFKRGCGPTAIAPYDDGYVVLCHIADRLVTITARGAPRKYLSRDVDLEPFVNPNDAGADDAGGVYFSASGIFSRSAPAEGALLYLDAEGDIHRLASDLQYTNGIVFDAARKRVLVSEHLGNRILAFPVTGPGQVESPEVFVDLTRIGLGDLKAFPPQGPDGLELDAAGNVFAAHYGAGALLIFSSSGTLRERMAWSEPLITSVTLSADEKYLFLTGSEAGDGRWSPGRVERLGNPLKQGGNGPAMGASSVSLTRNKTTGAVSFDAPRQP
ncbi:MAG: SMP-30/gluconolactonase/LRE family protein [Alphaproteobacteria bacterium]